MNRSFCMLITASTLTLFSILFVEQTHAGNVRSPCILTGSEKALVSDLTRLDESSYFATQANIKECVILGVTTLLIRYENGHIGLFNTTETIYSNSGQTQTGTRDTKVPDVAHTTTNERFDEFVKIWHSADSPDKLSQADLARADVIAQQLLNTVASEPILSSLGARGNRYLALIEQANSLPAEALLFFYNGYFDSDHARLEDIPMYLDKRAAVGKLIEILETRGPFHSYHIAIKTKQIIKEIDAPSYVRLQALGILTKDDK